MSSRSHAEKSGLRPLTFLDAKAPFSFEKATRKPSPLGQSKTQGGGPGAWTAPPKLCLEVTFLHGQVLGRGP